MKKIAVILSGCGFMDGAEITEAVSTFISLDRRACQYDTFAPDINLNTVNHISSEAEGQRNVLQESARICRGRISDLSHLDPEKYDGLVFPGGFGVAKNLCDWADKGALCSVNKKIESVIQHFFDHSKPILAICIAPALIARVLGAHGVSLTIGNDSATAQEIEKTGAVHEDCKECDFVTDRGTKIISTPAYMYDSSPHNVYLGISRAVDEFVEMA